MTDQTFTTGDLAVDRQLKTRMAKDRASAQLALHRANLPDLDTLVTLKKTVASTVSRLEALERKSDKIKADIVVRQPEPKSPVDPREHIPDAGLAVEAACFAELTRRASGGS